MKKIIIYILLSLLIGCSIFGKGKNEIKPIPAGEGTVADGSNVVSDFFLPSGWQGVYFRTQDNVQWKLTVQNQSTQPYSVDETTLVTVTRVFHEQAVINGIHKGDKYTTKLVYPVGTIGFQGEIAKINQ